MPTVSFWLYCAHTCHCQWRSGSQPSLKWQGVRFGISKSKDYGPQNWRFSTFKSLKAMVSARKGWVAHLRTRAFRLAPPNLRQWSPASRGWIAHFAFGGNSYQKRKSSSILWSHRNGGRQMDWGSSRADTYPAWWSWWRGSADLLVNLPSDSHLCLSFESGPKE